MLTVVRNTPSCLIPKELFKEETIQEYWNVLFPNSYNESIGCDNFEDSFLLYPKPQNTESIHEVSLMYKNIREQFFDKSEAICLNVDENICNLMILKDLNILFMGHFNFSVNEDIVYRLVNFSQHFFENISNITFFYRQLPPTTPSFLKKYFTMIQI